MPELISIARLFLPENIIFISTNGDYLKTKEDVQRLFDAGLTWMGVSHYDKKNEHLKDYVEFPTMVHTSLETLKINFYNRGGNIPMGCEYPVIFCNWIFGKGYINYKGDMIVCCSDYQYKTVIGNVMERSFIDLYNSEKYEFYRQKHTERNISGLPLCRDCNRIIKKEEWISSTTRLEIS